MNGTLVPTKEALNHLTKCDSILATAIAEYGVITKRVIDPNPFTSLLKSIIGQQVSMAAARSMQAKFMALVGNDPHPNEILSLTNEQLRECGLSRPKIKYVYCLSEAITDGTVVFDKLAQMSDKEIIAMLTKVKGIGVWTAEMFLIFCLGRPNVLSALDLGIRRGIMRLYQLEEYPSKEFIEKLRKRFTPYNTFASFYLWEVSTN